MTTTERHRLLALTMAGALLGGSAATWFCTGPPGRRLLVAAGAALVAAAAAWWLTESPASQPRSAGPEPPPSTEPDAVTPWWSPPAERAPRSEPATRPAAGPDLRARAASGGRTGPAPSALIAQCPRCGGFRLDVRREGNAHAFRCAGGCEHTWSWALGSPWPPVVVRRAPVGDPSGAHPEPAVVSGVENERWRT